ncbi:MAG: phage major capsid protein [Clostridia bacterium]|nr:phage major capsid protein [Clostridia bacterium]
MIIPIINREQAEALIQEQLVETIFQDAPKSSVFMSLARKLPNMTSKQTRIPVLDVLPTAYWVNGDTGFKQTSEQAWDNVYLTAAELAVIVPIPEAVLDDASFDIMGEVKPRIIEAIGQRVDSAVIFGNNRPSEWQNDIITVARNAGNNVAATGKMYDNLLGEGGVWGKVEDDGYDVNGAVAAINMKSSLRGIKDDAGRPIFVTDMQGSTPYAIVGSPLTFPKNGSFDKSVAQIVAGDFSQAVYAIRQDITVKILDQGVIQDPTTKEIIYNLAQQDMVALRIVFRMGWALPNPATRMNGDRSGCPFAYLEPASPVKTYDVKFTVTDSEGNAIEKAKVDVNGSIQSTDESGVATFALRNGSYPYKVKASGYKGQTGTLTVSNAAPEATTIKLIKD